MVTMKKGGNRGSMETLCGDPESSSAESTCGTPRAILTQRKNSHPFQERILNLEQPVKIGRSVARTRPSPNNGIFDCKVLSRNHARMWYENEKFYIQDTKSSNGTFVNSQRLSRGSEDSPPREIRSGDIVQFGVDVIENQRKGHEESDENFHIVTHGCIVATLKLIYPNGKEALPCIMDESNPAGTYNQEDLCKLQLIIFEATQREIRLRNKLDELQSVISALQDLCHNALTVRFEETQLLAQIEHHEKRAKVLKKMPPGSVDAAEMDVVNQLLRDVEKLQTASHEIQERLHRQLLESEQNLTVAKVKNSSLEAEIQHVRELFNKSEATLQELAAKCTVYVQTIENLESQLKTQLKINEEMCAEHDDTGWREGLAKLDLDSVDWPPKSPTPSAREAVHDPGVIGQWPVVKTVAQIEVLSDHYAKIWANNDTLEPKEFQLKPNVDRTESTETISVVGDVTNEIVVESENGLKLDDEIEKLEDIVDKPEEKKKIQRAMVNAEKRPPILVEKADCDDSEMTVEHIRQLVETLRTETEKRDKSYEKLILCKRNDGSAQTEDNRQFVSTEMNTDPFYGDDLDPSDPTPPIELLPPPENLVKSLGVRTTIRRGRSKEIQNLLISPTSVGPQDQTSQIEEISERGDQRSFENTDEMDTAPQNASENDMDIPDDAHSLDDSSSSKEAVKRLEEVVTNLKGFNGHALLDNLGEIHDICDSIIEDDPIAAERLRGVKKLINRVSGDVVELLVREEANASMQGNFEKSLSEADVAALSLADRFWAIVIGFIFCYVGSAIMGYLGFQA